MPAIGPNENSDDEPQANHIDGNERRDFDQNQPGAFPKLSDTVHIDVSASAAAPQPVADKLWEAQSGDSTDFRLSGLPTGDPLPLDLSRRYVLQGEIGRGGVGVIFKGYDNKLAREIAFKVLLDVHRDKSEVKQRFIREARITAGLQHPGIMPIYEIGRFTDGRPFFTMGLLEGRTLEMILAGSRSSIDDLPKHLNIFEQVCQAVAYAHAKGVVHRDLKPANIMVADFGVVKVMDWGVAKVLDEGAVCDETSEEKEPASEEVGPAAAVTRLGSVMGTPAYMSPEQAQGENERIDKRADVFGLGAILCEILTGSPPYAGTHGRHVHRLAAAADLSNAFERLDACAADMELVVLTKNCLAARPEDRPVDASELARALNAYRESELRRSERDLVRFFELSMDLFCIAGLDGFFYRVNSNFSKVLGYSQAELVSQPFLNFVHADDKTVTLAEMVKLSQGRPVVQFCNRYRDVHGGYRWFEWTAKSIIEEKIVFAVARDVTERVILEQKLHAQVAPPPIAPDI